MEKRYYCTAKIHNIYEGPETYCFVPLLLIFVHISKVPSFLLKEMKTNFLYHMMLESSLPYKYLWFCAWE